MARSGLQTTAAAAVGAASYWKVIRPPRFSIPGAFAGLKQLYQYRDLLITLSLHRFNVRYKQSRLGALWAIVQPVALMLIYTVIFTLVTRVPSNGLPYSVFVFTALLPWTFFSNVLTSAANSLVAHHYLVSKVYFPREILPLTYVIAGLVDLLIGGAALACLMAWHRIAPTVQTLWAVPILALAAAFVYGFSLILSIVHVDYRDVGLALPLLLQIWVFASPVVYPLSAVPEWLRPYYDLNPMAGVVENFRRVILQGQGPDAGLLALDGAIIAILLPAAYAFFKRREATLADTI